MGKLFIVEGPDRGRSFRIKGQTVFIGRSPANDIQMRDKTISRQHLKIVRKGDKYFVEDLQSKNGTYVNGEQIRPGVEIEVNEGHPIVIGMSVICLGEGCLELVKSYLDSLDVSETTKGFTGTETIVLK
ncbi:MAG: FHA domain-containing protein [Deltaproteobacteria bacterium]|nr:FHA domain-containing protein [Deltaproteobacteria bacterium]MBW1921316.1 FHA domain-containing protein [Deltaproteobacteria bacterium]MBW1936760.1 FHA domain-containing protein [Deltaproteobacteria bacterium]MBW1979277.1 FHA domain-containing protein [Deltaproteobacteria bacterium]MBW2046827.1 FHA domain-containing protein [Deltaproteobacteria bacterium]